MINRIVLVGRTTRDPESRGSADKVTAIFTVAVDNRMKDKDGKTTTTFVPCVAFGKQAENVLKFVKKGNLVGVEGRLNQRTYEKDGQKRSVYEVICDSVQFLESKKSTEVENEEPEVPAFDDVSESKDEGSKNTDSLDLSAVDDLPF